MSGAQQKSEPFKIGDKVWYGTSIYSIDKFRGKDDRIAEISNDTTAIDVWTKDLTPIKVAPTVAKKEEKLEENGWLDMYDDTEGLPLDFWSNNEDTGKNELYCDCVLPNLKKETANFNAFYVCLDCKKEKI
jgi:hypothetical protein